MKTVILAGALALTLGTLKVLSQAWKKKQAEKEVKS